MTFFILKLSVKEGEVMVIPASYLFKVKDVLQ